MDVMVGVGIASLQGKDGRIRWGIELDDGLHGQRPVDEVRRLVVDILDLDNHALIVRVCIHFKKEKKNSRRLH